jgi:hypothetical protein
MKECNEVLLLGDQRAGDNEVSNGNCEVEGRDQAQESKDVNPLGGSVLGDKRLAD